MGSIGERLRLGDLHFAPLGLLNNGLTIL